MDLLFIARSLSFLECLYFGYKLENRIGGFTRKGFPSCVDEKL